jgi:transposase
MLTQEQKDARVQWAIRHKDDDWNRTVFTDETCYQLFRNTIRRWSKNPKAEIKRIPKNRQKIMAWGGISVKGLVGFYSFKDIMDGAYYIRILKNHLIPNARRLLGRHWRLQQDNDPKHRSRLAMDFLWKQAPEVMEWPSNSPDVNPVENLWSHIKRSVEKRKPSNLDELDDFLHEEWEKIDLYLLNNLIKSMKTRCLALIDSKGERINY